MKIKELLILSLTLGLMACSSAEKQSEGEENLSPPPMREETTPLPDGVKPEPKAPDKRNVPAANPVSALDKAQSNLQEAIKAQNEDAIYRASTQVLSLSPQDIRALNSLGIYHYNRGKLVAAQYFFSKVLAVNASVSEAHNNMGLVHLAMKENRDAIKSFRKAIELDSNNSAAAANLGALYVEQKDYTKAIIAMEMAVKRGNRTYKSLVNYGVALAGIGQSAQAKDQYEQALKLNSTGREAMYDLAVLQIEQLKQYQQGLDLLNKLKFLGAPDTARMRINALENKAKAGLQ